MGAFRIDNPLIRAMIHVANLMILSFFFLLCALPAVTLLPAAAALYHTVVKVVRKSGSGVIRCYFRSFVGALKKGIPLTLLALGTGVLVFLALRFGYHWQESSVFGAVYFLVGCVIAFLWLSLVLALPAPLSRFEGGIGMYLRMGAYFSGKNLGLSLLRVLLLAFTLLLADFYPIALLVLPGIYTDLTAGGLEKQILAFMEENGLEDPGEEASAPAAEEEGEGPVSGLALEAMMEEKEEDRE